jgi:hypothetical protein
MAHSERGYDVAVYAHTCELVSLQAVCGEASDKALKVFLGKDIAFAENVGNMRDKVDAVSMEVENAVRNQPVTVMPQVRATPALLKSVYISVLTWLTLSCEVV